MRELSRSEIKEYQLLILDHVHQFCLENKINYFLGFGTLIGAIRHKGYIPWDDDVDIMMLRDDYDKFVSSFNDAYDDFRVYAIKNNKRYNLPYAKIAYEKTLQVDTNLNYQDMNLGINIDLFPVDRIPVDVDKKKLIKDIKYIDIRLHCKGYTSFKNVSVKRMLKINYYRAISLFWTKRKLGEKYDRIARQYNNLNIPSVSCIASFFYKIPIFNIDLFKPIEVSFEGRTYFGPQGYDEILRAYYGDYMRPPPEEKRVSNHSFTAYLK